MAKKYLSDTGLAQLIQRIKAIFCRYSTCTTAAATAAKTVTLSNFKLVTGTTIKVKFTITNTATSTTLNVNGTGERLFTTKARLYQPNTLRQMGFTSSCTTERNMT